MFHLMQQIHHPNDKDTKYSIPIKKCANQNTKYANLNTKCSEKQVRRSQKNAGYGWDQLEAANSKIGAN